MVEGLRVCGGLWVAVDSVRRREGGWCDHLAAIL